MSVDYRARMQYYMKLSVNDQERYRNWNYEAVRPQRIPSSYQSGQYVEADCSDGCRMIARWAGVKDDPAGNNYDSYGNSSSIWAHLPHIDLHDAQPGDMVTFGSYTGEHHVAMFYDLADRHDPIVWNMGTDGQPIFTRLSNEIRYHSGQRVTVCRVKLPPIHLSPQDKLRAMTGFWSWMQWKLGEGHWKKYKPASKKVRPNVPAMPPLKWWKAYGKFLLARKKGNKKTR